MIYRINERNGGDSVGGKERVSEELKAIAAASMATEAVSEAPRRSSRHQPQHALPNISGTRSQITRLGSCED